MSALRYCPDCDEPNADCTCGPLARDAAFTPASMFDDYDDVSDAWDEEREMFDAFARVAVGRFDRLCTLAIKEAA